ncbi:MAG: hypothetical protein ACLFQX_12270 [Candidatus Kapaibacterium sp.]
MQEDFEFDNPFEKEFDKKDVVRTYSDEDIRKKEEQPFGEKFEKKDVVGRQPDDVEELMPPGSARDTTTRNMDDILADSAEVVAGEETDMEELQDEMDMSDDERLSKHFYDEYNLLDRDTVTDEDRVRQNFKDFFVVPKLSGRNTRMPKSHLYPAELIKAEQMKVEVTDDPVLDEEDKRSSVIVNRNPKGEVESIEVVCSCGERTLIMLDYSETGDEGPITHVVQRKSAEEDEFTPAEHDITDEDRQEIFGRMHESAHDEEFPEEEEITEELENSDVESGESEPDDSEAEKEESGEDVNPDDSEV